MSLLQTLRFVANHPLNSHNRFGAVGKFARWQIASRLWGGDFIYEWVNGTKVKVRTGLSGITGSVYVGLHEFNDMAFLLHFLRPEDLFVDVGANVGSYTVLGAAAVGAETIAIEPIPSTFATLEENVRLNNREGRVKCLNIGIGDKTGTLRFSADGDTFNHVLTPGEKRAQEVEVPVRTLDDVMAGRPFVLLKIDVEGYETAVINGAANTLSGTHPCAVIMELNATPARHVNGYGFDENHLLPRMAAYEFEPCSYDPLSRQLRRLDGKNAAAEGNTIFVRGYDFAAERVRTAPAALVHGRSL